MIKQKHFAWIVTECLKCHDEFNMDVVDTGPMLCPYCRDKYSCCVCKRPETEVDIVYNKKSETAWCNECTERAESYTEASRKEQNE